MTLDFISSSNSCGDVMYDMCIHISLSVLMKAVTKAGFDCNFQRNSDYHHYTNLTNLCWKQINIHS